MVTFPDIRGVFDNITPEAIKASMEASAIPTQIINWYNNFQINRLH